MRQTGDLTVSQQRLKIERLSLSQARLEESLLPILRGNVFHVTTRSGFQGITKDGFIRNNKSGLFPCSFPQSNRSYARNRAWVSVFDLRAISDDQLQTALSNFYFLAPPNTKDNPFFLFLSESYHPQLVPWTQARNEEAWREMFIPIVEGFYPGDVPISCISRVVAVKIGRPRNRQSSLSKQMDKAVQDLYRREKKPF